LQYKILFLPFYGGTNLFKMKNLLFILFLILSTSIVHSQEQENQFTNSIGMDVIPSFAVLFDGDINYLEFGYVKSLTVLI